MKQNCPDQTDFLQVSMVPRLTKINNDLLREENYLQTCNVVTFQFKSNSVVLKLNYY